MKKWIIWAQLIWCVTAMAETDIVEERYLKASHRDYQYEGEKIRSVVVNDAEELGKLTALRFIDYIREHPTAVVALPTGKTPEIFIKYLVEFKKNGIDGVPFPDTSRLKFVQLDEFYPLDPTQENSFTSFVRKHYLSVLGIAPERALTMEGLIGPTIRKHGLAAVFPEGTANLNILTRTPKNRIEKMQKEALEEAIAFCKSYEDKIKEWGGISFFLGGIGPDGHIAFNLPGSLHDSQTRLIPLNYETAAASASDLGGIEQAIGKLAATIGLATICMNPEATAIIFAAGEGKASVVATAIESPPAIRYPATALQKMVGARFYLTKGAASSLKQRKFLDYIGANVPASFIDETLIEISLKKEKPLLNITKKDLSTTPSGHFLSERFPKQLQELKQKAVDRILASLARGLQKESRGTIVHTGPHHDDIMLSYHPLAKNPINRNYYVCMTSGSNSVTTSFTLDVLTRLKGDLSSLKKELTVPYGDALALFAKAIKGGQPEQRRKADDLILAKKLEAQFGLSAEELAPKISSIAEELRRATPGVKDPKDIQQVKGLIREAEEDRVWSLAGVKTEDVIHFRSSFYTGGNIDDDVRSFQALLHSLKPDLVTVAIDPENTGPSTHFKVLQLVTSALTSGIWEKEPTIWGYRNVWDRFDLSEVNFIAPMSQQEMDTLHKTFLDCYGSQVEASFPSPNFKGPFSAYALEILARQKKELETILGESFFTDHPDERVRNCAGFILLKEMTIAELAKIVQ